MKDKKDAHGKTGLGYKRNTQRDTQTYLKEKLALLYFIENDKNTKVSDEKIEAFMEKNAKLVSDVVDRLYSDRVKVEAAAKKIVDLDSLMEPLNPQIVEKIQHYSSFDQYENALESTISKEEKKWKLPRHLLKQLMKQLMKIPQKSK